MRISTSALSPSIDFTGVLKDADADLLREMIGFAAEKLLALEVSAKTGAGCGEKNVFRPAQRNGYRDRDWGEAEKKTIQ